MSLKNKNNFILVFLLIAEISTSYPIFPTILTVSIPILEKQSNTYLEARVENNYLRWLQASGADLVVVHPWSKYDEIDTLLEKVNGILLQGNSEKIDNKSSYYEIVKYIYKKVIELNDKGVKMPLLAIGDDIALLSAIINEDNISIITAPQMKIDQPSNINLYLSPDKTIIFNEFEKEDMKPLQESNILPNNLNYIISVGNFISNFNLSENFKLVASSKNEEGQEYVSIAEGKKYPIIMMSFHPEYVPFEQNTSMIVPDSLESIFTSRFIGNSFVFYGRKNVEQTFTVEEKEEYCYIDPYGEYPKIIDGRFNYLFKNTQ